MAEKTAAHTMCRRWFSTKRLCCRSFWARRPRCIFSFSASVYSRGVGPTALQPWEALAMRPGRPASPECHPMKETWRPGGVRRGQNRTKETASGEQTPLPTPACTSLYLLHLPPLFCLHTTPPHLPPSVCPSLLLLPAQALVLWPKQAGARRPLTATSALHLSARPLA